MATTIFHENRKKEGEDETFLLPPLPFPVIFGENLEGTMEGGERGRNVFFLLLGNTDHSPWDSPQFSLGLRLL